MNKVLVIKVVSGNKKFKSNINFSDMNLKIEASVDQLGSAFEHGKFWLEAKPQEDPNDFFKESQPGDNKDDHPYEYYDK